MRLVARSFYALLVAALLVGAAVSPGRAQLNASDTWASTAGGSSNVLTLTLQTAGSMNDLIGVPIRFEPSSANVGGGTTINVNSYGAYAVDKPGPSGPVALTGGEFQAGQAATVVFDSVRFNLMSVNGTLASLTVPDQLVTGGANATTYFIGINVTSGVYTIDCGKGPLQLISFGPSAAVTLAAPVSDGSCMVQMYNASASPALSLTGFTYAANNYGDPFNEGAGAVTIMSVWRINGLASFTFKALQ